MNFSSNLKLNPKKQLVLVILCITSFLSLNAQQDSLTCVGAVGDVKWSVLDPEKFQEVNGDCWTLMDGQTLPADTKLKAMGFDAIPYGQGVFLRAIDLREPGKRLDPDIRTIPGHYQRDAFQGHRHISKGAMMYSNHGNGRNGSTSSNVDSWENLSDIMDGYTSDRQNNGTPRVANETRPKNIALYLYIRIN